jgi:hypothetical protein
MVFGARLLVLKKDRELGGVLLKLKSVESAQKPTS